jgi:enoyl-CoA hydratase/carnithine racemase
MKYAGSEIIDRHIGLVTFGDEERKNSLNADMLRQLTAEIDSLIERDARVIVVTGAGDTFSAGLDIKRFYDAPSALGPSSHELLELLGNTVEKIDSCPVPTIAMIQGHCIGGSFELASAFDMRIASSETLFGIPPARLGLVYPYPGIMRIARIVGEPFARELFFTGSLYDASVMQRHNFLNIITDKADLRKVTMNIAATISGNSPTALSGIKKIFTGLYDESKKDLFQKLVDDSLTGKDFAEGRKAFTEKRKPDYS